MMKVLMPWGVNEPAVPEPTHNDPLAFLEFVYRSPSFPTGTRIRAAAELAKYRHAQLRATAIVNANSSMAEALDRARLRAKKVAKVIEGPTFRRRV
jgi:hypothetical protein